MCLDFRSESIDTNIITWLDLSASVVNLDLPLHNVQVRCKPIVPHIGGGETLSASP